MSTRIIFIFLILLALVAIVFGTSEAIAQTQQPQAANPIMSSAHFTLDWNVSGGVSGGAGSSAHYAMNQVTVSQTAANSMSASRNYSLCTGWECGGPIYAIDLPVVIR